MVDEKKKYHVLMLSDEDKERLTGVTQKAMDEIKKTKNVTEMAFVLRVLIETFEDTQDCVVPFKGRYTEPVWNYKKGGLE